MIDVGAAQGWFADVSRVATGGLMSAIWQGILLAAAVGLGLRLLPKTPATVRFAIWFGVFLVVTGLPVVSLWPHPAGSMQAGGHAAWLTLDSRWSVAIAAVWAVASLVRAGTLVVAAFRVRTLWKRAQPVEVGGASGLHPTHRESAAMDGAPGVLDGAAGFSPVTRRAQICTSDEVDRPTVIGFFSPKILIPTWLLEKLTAVELEQIVLHETGHLGRADDWMNLLQKVALVMFPLNPALAWVERRLCFERELACDERVLQATQAPKAYAACLATLAEHRMGRRGLALALGALGRESELGRRVRRILWRGETMRPLHAKLVLGGAMLGLLGGAAGLERCPQVVGFASAPERNAALVAPARVRSTGELGYETVVFRARDVQNSRVDSGLRPPMNVSRDALLRTSGDPVGSVVGEGGTGPQRLNRPAESGVYGMAKANPLSKALSMESWNSVRTAVNSMGPAEAGETAVVEARSTGNLAGQRSGQVSDGDVEWVVVTSWRGEDGSHMVLTMASSSSAKGRMVQNPVVSDSEPSSYQVHPYAAVPVRGGWLVFQL